MERDPLAFVWRTSPVLHLVAFALLLLAFPLGWMGIDLVRVAIDDAISGNAFENAPFASFLRLQIDLPDRVADEPLVLFRGIGLERVQFVVATLVGLVALALLAGLFVLLLRQIGSAVETRSVARLRRTVLDGILGARASAREDARQAAGLAGEELAGNLRLLGGAVVTPVVAVGAMLLSVLYALSIDWKLMILVLDALVLAALAWPRRLAAEREGSAARRAWGRTVRSALDELVQRLPALRAHGTAPFERERLARELRASHRPVQAADRRSHLYAAATAFALVVGPALVLGLGAWFALNGRPTPGEIVATGVATLLALAALTSLLRWRQGMAAARPLFEEIARTLGALQARGRVERTTPLPGAGPLVASGVSAYDPSSGARIAGVDLSLAFPSHVAAVGDVASGARVFAALVGGQLEPSAGTLTFGGADLTTADPTDRAKRLAFAGGETILIRGSLRENILYGCGEPDSPEMEHRLLEAASAAGLDGAIHARGLAGTVNPTRESKLAAAVVDARRAVRAALAAERLEDLVEPFDPARYNRQATIGENILFGMPLGDTFREEHLPSHPFVRAILEAEGLTKTLAGMGLSIAASTIEIFADIPDGHPLFERFSFFSSGDRGYFEDLVERQGERRHASESARERERLMSLALRYSESRHRFGLLDAEIEARLVAARAAFAKLLPTSLKPAIEFYDPDALCAAASLQDNLLFGRVNQDRAGASTDVRRIVRRVLTDRGLDKEVIRIGLDSPVETRGADLAPSEVAAVDVARCLVRKPDVLIVERALDGLSEAKASVARLRRALVGRGLILVTPELSQAMDTPLFDAILRFDRGSATIEDRRKYTAARPMQAPEPVAQV